jgi:uncharacterized protein (DUF1015 family)
LVYTVSDSKKKENLVRPFAALRPVPDLAQEVVAPPYDVINTIEAIVLAKDKPWSFLHISKPEIDLPIGTDIYSDAVYEKARENFNRMVSDGILKRDDKDYYYIYRLQLADHIQTGIVCAGSIAAYEANLIRRHEHTRPDKEKDRVRQIDTINAQTGPVFTIHKSNNLLDEVIKKNVAYAADYHVIGDGKVEHTLWVVTDLSDIEKITKGFDALGVLYIADGHHRSAAASRVFSDRHKKDGNTIENKQNGSFLLVSFPEDEVKVFEYNRVVQDLNGYSESDFLNKISEKFYLEKQTEAIKPIKRNSFSMYLPGVWYSLSLKLPLSGELAAVDQLDISILTNLLLEPILGVGDPRVDPRIDFIGGIRGLVELEKRVDTGGWSVAFALYPTSVQDLISVADEEEIMPPKTTWFEPKLADGMVSLVLE